MVIDAAVASDGGVCPRCGTGSARVHSRYSRWLADTAVAGRAVTLRLRVRRFFCDNTGCAARTFVEQVVGLTVKWARRTSMAARVLCAIGLALAGRTGARLAGRLAMPASRATLLRLVRKLPDPAPAVLTRIGVDDFAFRRGHTYGSVIVDIDTHQPIDVLPDRTRDTLADWLRTHPGVELVCRDRAGAYAEAVRAALPHAIQVADRRHLWHNLIEAVEKTVIAERAALRPAEPNELEPAANEVAAVLDSRQPEPSVRPLEGRLATRTRQRWAAVQDLLAAGRSISAIARELRLQRKTVRRFAWAATVEELLDRPRPRRDSLLDPYKPHLQERFTAGGVDAVQLTREITELGYRGSLKTVRTYLHPLRAGRVAPKAGGDRTNRPAGHRLDHPPPRPAHRGRAAAAETGPGSQSGAHRHPPARAPVRSHAHPTSRPIPRRLDARRRDQRHRPGPVVRRRAGQGPRRSHRRTDPPVQLRTGRRRHHPHQGAQAADVRPRRIQPAPQTNP